MLELVSAVLGISCGSWIMVELFHMVPKVWAHKQNIAAHNENIARLEHGYPPIDFKGGRTAPRLTTGAPEGGDGDFIEYGDERGN